MNDPDNRTPLEWIVWIVALSLVTAALIIIVILSLVKGFADDVNEFSAIPAHIEEGTTT